MKVLLLETANLLSTCAVVNSTSAVAENLPTCVSVVIYVAWISAIE